MLQQTSFRLSLTTTTVGCKNGPPFYAFRRLLSRSSVKLNDMWAGLGYYRRARFLLEGAKMIVAAGGDEYPNTLSSLRKQLNLLSFTTKGFQPVFDGTRNDESSMVTDYPIEVVKANQRNDFSIVCVVEISASLDGSHQCKSDSRSLLIRRLDEGLLVDLWEFPLCYIG
ncbi:hypothetical protein V6N11_012085 [Hibiscus sabdariffa]|uniref:Uncharacterized protein n=1 Tax=Hibiscus sabdariffa TaxID=183260 RepID=A0ABR2QA18_9ROSI